MAADKDIKFVDLSKENLNTVKEAIRIASSIGASGFRFYVNPSFVKNGLVITKIVSLITEPPPKSQMLLNFAGLKNLKKTLDFAKSVLGEDGEVTVEEKHEPVVHATTAVEEAPAVLDEEAPADATPATDAEDSAEVEPAKKRKTKKATATTSETPAEELE
ncbi:MAG: hypothetical protein EB127_02220 [Alphaproteobacteria bacterium]|nr:hypothetical protein [Alphaproteobacteria bacterium]